MTTITLAIYAYLGGAWTDITSDTRSTGASAEWGTPGNKPLDKLATTGSMRFSLNNNTGKYTPGGSSVIHAEWGKGVPVKAVFTALGKSNVRFRGVIDSIKIDAGTTGSRLVHCTVLDWMDYAANYTLDNPPIELDQRADQAIETILEDMPIQPQATDIDTGAVTFPLVFNDATFRTKAYSEFHKLIMSEFGSRLYIKKDSTYGETLRFENSTNRVYSSPVKQVVYPDSTNYNLLKEDGDALLKEDGDNILLEASIEQVVHVDNTMLDMDVVYGENIINKISVSVHPPRIDTKDSQIFKLDSPLFIDAYNTKSFFVEYTEELSKRQVAALPPEVSYPTTLFHFDAGNGEELIVDEGGKAWDDYSAELVTNLKVIGQASLYLDGSNSYCQGSTSADYEFGSGDFTVEWLEYRFNADSGAAVLSRDGTGGFCPFAFGKSDGSESKVYITSNGSSWDIANGKSFGVIPIATWTHYAITRRGDKFRMFTNGVRVQTWTNSDAILASTSPMVIGKSGSTYLTACLDEMRIVKGKAYYITNFTPSTDPHVLSGLIYSAWTNENGTGTELTPDFDITVSYGGSRAEITVENTGSTAGYLTTLKIFGKIVETVSPVTDIQENAESIAQYGYHELSIDQPYEADFTSGREKAAEILDLHRFPLVEINKITMSANRDNAHAAYFMDTDVGDLVEVTEDQTETDAAYYIHRMGWSAVPGAASVNVNYWWGLEKHRDGVEPLGIEFADLTSNYNHIEWGYLQAIAIENVPYRIWSFWFKLEDMATTGHFISCYAASAGASPPDAHGYMISLITGRKLRYYGTSGANMGVWVCNSGLANTPNTWFHVLVAYDSRSTSNNAAFYVNGSSYAATFGTWEATTIPGEIGTNLKISISNLAPPSDLSLKDFRIYNGDQVSSPAALALALYNEGAYGEDNKTGLLFRGFYAPGNELAEYEGANLTEDQKIIDDIGFAVGTPKNAPLGVAL